MRHSGDGTFQQSRLGVLAVAALFQSLQEQPQRQPQAL